MSGKLIAFASSILTPTVTIAYIDTYWHKGYTQKYLAIGQNVIKHPAIKPVLDDLHNTNASKPPSSKS